MIFFKIIFLNLICLLFDENWWLSCSLVWFLAGLFSSFSVLTYDLIWEVYGYFNLDGFVCSKGGNRLQNPENKYLHSFLNILWFKWCLPDSMRVWNLCTFIFFFSLIFSPCFSWPSSTHWGWKQGSMDTLLSCWVSHKASTVLLTQYQNWTGP